MHKTLLEKKKKKTLRQEELVWGCRALAWVVEGPELNPQHRKKYSSLVLLKIFE
jgi:hypothetical protein